MTIINQFINYLKAKRKSNNTVISYLSDLKLLFGFLELDINTITLDEIKAITYDKLFNFISSQNNKSNSTINRYIASIQELYKFLCDELEVVEKNPSTKLNGLRPKINRKVPEILNENEAIKLLNIVDKMDKAHKVRDYAIITLFLNCGLRISELVGLNLSDIQGNVLVVREDNGKGHKSRKVNLNEACIAAIKDYLKERSKDINDPALFLSQWNKRISISMVKKLDKEYLTKIKKGNLSTHKLRHTAATNWLNNHTDIRVIQELLGHNDISTTTIYAQVSDENKKLAVSNNNLAKIRMTSQN